MTKDAQIKSLAGVLNMAEHPNARIIGELEKMIEEMQYLVDHPRIQQRRWVAIGRQWLPILRHAKDDLARPVGESVSAENKAEPLSEKVSMLTKIRGESGEAYLSVNLNDIARVSISHRGEDGWHIPRSAYTGFELKNGLRYHTSNEEAQRIIDSIKKQNGE